MSQAVRTSLVACSALLIAWNVSAQDVGLVCDTRAENLSTDTRLVSYRTTPASARQLRTEPRWNFGPFDRSVYGFDFITFFIDEVGPFEESMGGQYGPLDLVLRIDGADSTLFRVLPEGAKGDGRGALIGVRGLASASDASGTVRFATENRALPLFVVSFDDGDARSTTTNMFLLDLRVNRKRVPLAFTCVSDVIAGACGAFDGLYQSAHKSIDCQWSAADRDLRCGTKEGVTTTWGDRASAWYLPFAHLDPAIAVEKESAAQVEQLARQFDSDQGASSVNTGRWGPVHAIATVPGQNGGALVLLGAAGLSTRFGARFMVMRLDRNSRATLHAVVDAPVTPAYWQSLSEVEEIVIGGRPVSSALSFAVHALESSSDLRTLLRVRVRDGQASAAYLIGLDDRSDSITAGAMRLATDTSEYFRCGRAVTPPNVFDVRRTPSGPFQAELQIEPPREVRFDSDQPVSDSDAGAEVAVPGCPTTMTVRWDRGFALEEPEAQSGCSAPSKPRFVEVRDDGTVLAVDKLAPKGQ